MKKGNVMADVKYFWKELAVRERLVCMAVCVIISLTSSILGALLSAAFIVGCTCVLAMFGILQSINWRSAKTQKRATMFMVGWTIGSILGRFGILSIFFKLLLLIVAILIAKLVYEVFLKDLFKNR